MKSVIKSLAASAIVAAPAFAGEQVEVVEEAVVVESGSIFSSELAVNYASSYEFRGVDFGDHLVDAGLATVADLGNDVELGLGAWYGSLVQEDYTELNLAADITKSFGAFDLGLGYTYYYFGADGSDANELGIFGSYELCPVFTANLGAYYDFQTEGTYIETSLEAEKACCLWDKLTWNAELGIAYNVDYYVEGSGFNHAFLEIAAPIALTETATLTPYVKGTLAMDVLEAHEDNGVVGGVSLAVTF